MMILILDIDGTLADCAHRAHHVDKVAPDWELFLDPKLVIKDPPIPYSQNGFKALSKLFSKNDIKFLTGRNEKLRDCTRLWLKKTLGITIPNSRLIMRPLDNMDTPTVFKRKALKEIVKNDKKGGIRMAFDDDKFMMPVYAEFNIIALHAPEVWRHLAPNFKDLPKETAWRK